MKGVSKAIFCSGLKIAYDQLVTNPSQHRFGTPQTVILIARGDYTGDSPASIAATLRDSPFISHFFAIQIGTNLPTQDYINLLTWTGGRSNVSGLSKTLLSSVFLQVFDSDNYMEIAQRIKGTQCPITTPTPTSRDPDVLFLVETSNEMFTAGGIGEVRESLRLFRAVLLYRRTRLC